MIPHAVTSSPLFGLVLTIGAYAVALEVHRRWRFLHPLLVTCLLAMAAVVAAKIPLPDFKIGGDYLTALLGPATVALAVPLYKHRRTLGAHGVQIALAILAGGLVGIVSAGATAMVFHGSREILLSVLSKSATTPISVAITRALGGREEITAAITVCSGLLGAVAGPPLLYVLRLRKPSAIGLAVGTCAHGIGTSSLLRHSELQATYSALAMALNGILTATLLTPLAPVIQRML